MWHAVCFSVSNNVEKDITDKPIPEKEKIMKAKTATSNSNTGIATSTGSTVESQIYSVSLTVVGVSACAFGLWAFASIVGGMIAGGGPAGLVAGWFKAVFGI